MTETLLFKALVGSRAHGLAGEDSDYDYRTVYVRPTSCILGIPSGEIFMDQEIDKTFNHREDDDDTRYELGHFLRLACKSNPSILEVFAGRVEETTADGEALRALLPYVWNSREVFDAFLGYSKSQQKKFLKGDVEPKRANKFAVAYLRTLISGERLLRTGELQVLVPEEWREKLLAVKAGNWTKGQVLDEAEALSFDLRKAYEKNPDKKTDFATVNGFLLEMRKKYW